MKIRIIIQSRLSSTRLPAKALLLMGGLPTVVLCYKRAQTAGPPCIVATSESREDDLLVHELQKHQIPFVRGSLDDVVARICHASKDLAENDILVRLTADNLFPDGAFINEAIDTFIHGQHDFLTSTFENAALPYGMSVEIFRVCALREINASQLTPLERDNVTTRIAVNAKNKCYFTPRLFKQHLHHIRVTLDTFKDYTRLAQVFNSFSDPVQAPYQALIDKMVEFGAPQKGFPAAQTFVLGTAQLGMPYGAANKTGMPNEKQANEIMSQALEYGVKTFDTARAYGVSEERIGCAIGCTENSQVRVITKLNPLSDLNLDLDLKTVSLHVRASVLESCHALKRSCLDVLLLHRWSHYSILNQTLWKTLLDLKYAGYISTLGASLRTPAELIEALNEPEIKTVQFPLNILDNRWLHPEVQSLIQKRSDVKIYVRSVLLQGILANDAACWPQIEYVDTQNTLAKLDFFVNKFNRLNRADLCIAYVRSFDWIAGLVMGIENTRQLNENLELFQRSKLKHAEMQELQQAFSNMPVKLLDPAQWV